MKTHSFELPVDGTILKGTAWLPETPVAWMLIEHGMAEHHQRYADFAASLAALGIGVYGYDKRGHGLTAGLPDSDDWQRNSGWFAEKNGWHAIVSDSLAVLGWMRQGGVEGGTTGRVKAGPGGSAGVSDPTGHGHLPLFLMGHSLGSILVRDVVADRHCAGLQLAGVIISGTAGPAGAIGVVGKVLASVLIALRGATTPSPFLDRMVSGPYASQATGLKQPRTAFDWLSRDQAMVDAYIADPWCGFPMATSFYRDLTVGLAGLFTADYARRFPRDLPVLMFSGDRDPVGGLGKGVSLVHESYKSWGVKDLSLTLYAGGRHEMLNETNRLEVYRLVADWLLARIKPAS
jgi:alpha-beta hydrolase superfamily lysophospholipase